jgi:hypothetical protein
VTTERLTEARLRELANTWSPISHAEVEALIAEVRASRSAPPATAATAESCFGGECNENGLCVRHQEDTHECGEAGTYCDDEWHTDTTCRCDAPATGTHRRWCPAERNRPAPPAQGRGEIERLLAVFEANTRYVVIAKEADLNAAVEREAAARASLLAAFDRALAAQDGLREALLSLAKEWEDEAARRDEATQRAHAHERAGLRLGASFEREHARRLRALSTPAAPKKENDE